MAGSVFVVFEEEPGQPGKPSVHLRGVVEIEVFAHVAGIGLRPRAAEVVVLVIEAVVAFARDPLIGVGCGVVDQQENAPACTGWRGPLSCCRLPLA